MLHVLQQPPLCQQLLDSPVPTDPVPEASQQIDDPPTPLQHSTGTAAEGAAAEVSYSGRSSGFEGRAPPAVTSTAAPLLSQESAVVAMNIALLVLLLTAVRACYSIKAAAHSCQRRLPTTAVVAAAPAAALALFTTWCTSSHASVQRLFRCLQAHASIGCAVYTQARVIGRQLPLVLLWSLALSHGLRTDAQECAAALAFISLPTAASTANKTKAAIAVTAAGAAKASSDMKLASDNAATFALLPWVVCMSSAAFNFIGSQCWSSRITEAVQVGTNAGRRLLFAIPALFYIISVSIVSAGMMMLPVLLVDRCTALLLHCWPGLLLIIYFKVNSQKLFLLCASSLS